MPKWKNFNEYVLWREDQQVHNMTHDEALKWVFSALGIMDDPNPQDKSQQDEINDALSSPLSAYPDKLNSLANELQVKNQSNWPQIQAVLASPERSTVSKLVAALSANTRPAKTITDRPDQDSGDDETAYREPDGNAPL